jgi:hypothetical protein
MTRNGAVHVAARSGQWRQLTNRLTSPILGDLRGEA